MATPIIDALMHPDRISTEDHPHPWERARRLEESHARLLEALKNLHALVCGECPSVLEDDHHDSMVRAAIDAAQEIAK